MGKKFLRSELSRTGYIYPDNYMGAGSPDTYTVGSGGEDVVGNYERALVCGYVATKDGLHKGMAVRLLDLRHIDGSYVYGVIPEKDIFLGFFDKADREVCAKTLYAGNVITVYVSGQVSNEYCAKNDLFEATYACSRRRVLEDVRSMLRGLAVDDYVLGRVCGRGKNWSYKVDVGGGFRVFVNERVLGKHSVHSKNGLTGGLVLLRKTLQNSAGETDFKTCTTTFDSSVCDLLHGAQTRGILTRADGSGQNYAYIPNCGFIYIAGYMDERGENKPLKFNASDDTGSITIDGKTLQLGSIVQIEIVKTKESKLCGYIRGILSTDAVSGCTLL